MAIATPELLNRVQHGLPLSRSEQTKLALQLSVPAILAQLSTIMMQYIDASMVGSLGAAASASIGLISTTTWLLGGICSAAAAGFSVQVAQLIGARKEEEARSVFRQAITSVVLLAVGIMLFSVCIAPWLPVWLGGGEDICPDATRYFLVFALCIPLFELNYLFGGMLRCAGNMRVPSIVNVGMCILDVVFNYVLIFKLHMGVLGAAIGSFCALVIAVLILGWYVLFRSKTLGLMQDRGSYHPSGNILNKAFQIGMPIAVEHIAMCSAQIFSTIIVAPLGTVAIAANAFGITIEGLCYMPGYGIGDAATTLTGQSVGAGRAKLQRSFSYITVGLGVLFMSIMGILMYAFVPYLIPLMTPDTVVQGLTVDILRIEAFAEPMYAASIVAYGAMVGTGDTKMPCLMNLGSIWLVRISLALLLVGSYGLRGVWIAMAAELCFRGTIFLIRLFRNNKQLIICN